MRLAQQKSDGAFEIDMTPMIDITFQLIIFFMLAINFSEADQDERVRLPLSELAKPPEAAAVSPITVQMAADGMLIFGGELVTMDGLRTVLLREKQLLERRKDADVRDATIIIRADRDAKTGMVQQVIRACQESGFEKFVLRAKQQEVT